MNSGGNIQSDTEHMKQGHQNSNSDQWHCSFSLGPRQWPLSGSPVRNGRRTRPVCSHHTHDSHQAKKLCIIPTLWGSPPLPAAWALLHFSYVACFLHPAFAHSTGVSSSWIHLLLAIDMAYHLPFASFVSSSRKPFGPRADASPSTYPITQHGDFPFVWLPFPNHTLSSMETELACVQLCTHLS